MISNLFSNALKFTNKGDTIYVNLEQKNTDSRREFIVSVKDTGIGIDSEIFPRIFSKFATKSETGLGLGLFICKNIIEAHNGKIWAENNTYGKGGATFAFSLPLIIQQDDHQQESIDFNIPAIIKTYNIKKEEEETLKKKHIDICSSSHISHKRKLKRIFVVDDDYDHTVTFKAGLELAGFEVDVYDDSTIALSNFKPGYYDLLLIDIKMPKINGIDLYQKLLKLDDKVKVWFISAYEVYYKTLKNEDSLKFKETFLEHFIQKPVDIDNLVNQVKSALD